MSDEPRAAIDQRELAEVKRLVKAGQLPDARALCEQIAAASPANVDAMIALGRIAIDQYRWQDAIAIFDRALRLRVDPWSLGNLGVCHWKLGQLDEAEYCLRGAVEIEPALTRAHVNLAAVLHAAKRFDAALAQLDIAEKLDVSEHQVPMRRGCTLAALGRLDQAQQNFALASTLVDRFNYPRLIAFDRATFERITAHDVAVNPPVRTLDRRVDESSLEMVTLVSCNPPYVRKYGFPFIRSFAEHAGAGNLLHLHIYDTDPQIVGEVSALLGACAIDRYAVTTEASPFSASATQQRKAFYACGRLIHLPYWLEQYRCPILSLDVDFIVESSLDGLVAAAGNADVGLNARVPGDSPWLDVIANIIVAQPTSAARAYFNAVKNYALEYLAREPDAWLVDQSALYCVLKMMERLATPPVVAWIPPEAQNCLWHIGHAYDHLLADPRYRKYADA